MSLESLKLNKQITTAMEAAGYTEPTEVQQTIMTRMLGGQDMVIVAPKGSGKTTAYIAGIIMRLKHSFEEAPRALVLVKDLEEGLLIVEQMRFLAQNTDLRITPLFSNTKFEDQMDEMAEGTDIVIGTPDCVRAVYLKLGLNVNKIKTLVVDDAEALIKVYQLAVVHLNKSLVKCQRLVFTENLGERVEHVMKPFYNYPTYLDFRPDQEEEEAPE